MIVAMEGWIDIILQHYSRFAGCAFFGIVSVVVVNFFDFDLNLFLRIILSIVFFFAWIALGLLLEFLHSRDKKQ